MNLPASSADAARVDALLARLLVLHPRVIDLSLGRIRRLLDQLGRPHERLPPVFHVTGTNGKGSTCAYLRAMLEAAGRRVHVFTSPHLVRFNERIRLAGELISDGDLAALLEEVEAVNAGEPITFFEIIGAAAFLAFARVPADALVLEVGMGGRLDATNVIARPAASIITPVSLDHMSYLGDTVAAIAREKAGILKPGAFGIIGPQTADAAAVIEKHAASVAAPLRRFGREWTVMPTAAGLRYEGPEWRLDLPAPGLLGRHQYDNAGGALAALEAFDPTLPAAALAAGIAGVQWPARLQRLTQGPLARTLPAGSELWLDGGHNVACAEAVAAELARWPAMPMHLVFAMLDNRDPAAFLRVLAPLSAGLEAVAIPGEHKSWSAEAAAEAACSAGIPAAPAADLGAAMAAITTRSGGSPVRVLICGSLYLAGVVLAENS
ncbi:dihydrofolate synthase/folylpolyglutamate synthase [Stella humosa]|uniref:tetrahydrofolate synthase n=1 Tax=Stella humosa TaxID=94 RepID=A0A3N1LCC8_9PROT|nr:folylpolyglutamate synthase/dihydrofolate synthase family protein [Stella humosa]ROP90681.1 dihydrofolate synthase/folylpolyglutamate synthase [Stella humosa]BBK29419.1 bifunctional folylpolyglutamate synthase/dihydrofolate synthase [Stella humosa]